MDKTGIYGKTPRGLEEIDTRALKLPPKLRQLLIMVDGETDVASLAERFDQGNAVGHIIALEHMGLITLLRGTAANEIDTLREGANDPDGAQEDLDALRQDLSHLVLDSLGPDASDLAMQIEESTSREALRTHCEHCHTIMAGVLGKARAEKFRAQADALLG
ncbi:hypothetical protein B1C78_05435 [Thioalkalivibrio denitrificans]|uniref:Uncharacterized protein n=1 Tax=Thioalkalivibrio denitrificans TaxID=108003 RepID=A0A1V3NLN3_9GAMM|nr:hypothetical protein [Thioalkalivibrio denitrificans]OOG25970.1 hypothetical protein B1C78_05435 [Thioalkalivibrio denitrificans]